MSRPHITPGMVEAARSAFFREWHNRHPNSDVPIWLLIDNAAFGAAIAAALTTGDQKS